MDAELKSLVIVLCFNFTLTVLVITGFTCCHYYKHKKINRVIKATRTNSEGLLIDEEEEKKLIEDSDYPFGPAKEDENDSFSSSSFGDLDSGSLGYYAINKKVPPKLDPWLFKWIYQLYQISDKEMFQYTPADGYLYLYFLRGASILFFVLTFLNCGILLPIYAGEGKLGAENDLQVLTIGNIVKYNNNSKMWAVFSATIIVSLAAYFFIFKQKKRIDKVNYLTYDESLSEFDISKYTILIRNVPRTLRISDGDNMIFSLFREKYRDQVIRAHIIPNLAHLEEVMEQRNLNLKKLGYYVELNNQTQTRAQITMGSRLLCCKRKKVDAVNYYKEMIQNIDSLIPRIKNMGFKENTGVAYVTFASKEAQQKALKEFHLVKESPMGFINKQLQVQEWILERCSDPSDIIWKNLNK